jgi:hypothetical protein
MGAGFNQSVNRFRSQRGKILQQQILDTASFLGRDIEILDLGGRADYWLNVGLEGVARIVLINTTDVEFIGTGDASRLPRDRFEQRIGNACDLGEYADGSVDFVHSNSVIEHVGDWPEITAMAREARRVGRAGWIQTPAVEFPIEPHFHLPFIHWLSRPLEARALKLSPLATYRQCSAEERTRLVESIRLLSRREVTTLFPDCDIYVERFLIPKSYVARWQVAAGSGREVEPRAGRA